jgi:NAD(P)-dependent dehydrogenase (short-subunit alcohol dehydrogenase family)
MEKTLDGKVALITGASEGIGLAIANSLAKRGASIALAARGEEKLEQAQAKLMREYKGKHIIIPGTDVGQQLKVEHAFRITVEEYGRVDIIVNNAGYWDPRPITDTTEEDLKRSWNINTLGPFRVYKQVLKLVQEKKQPVIIWDIISQAGLYGFERMAAYGTSKGAHNILSKAVALDIKKLRLPITIYRVSPGLVNTKIFEKSDDTLSQDLRKEEFRIEPRDIGELIGDVTANPSIATTHDIELQPPTTKGGEMQITYL